mmetsp:Transcript_83361/g.212256  ORF Transcript_83361/g.212256 Transcript_83361/m.212256 type:complete len:201 (+) Transcript_83361:558-1160(+)
MLLPPVPLRFVKSPPWIMKPGMMRWNGQRLYCFKQSCLKFSVVFGTTLPYRPNTMRPAGSPPMEMSKKTFCVTSSAFGARPPPPKKKRVVRGERRAARAALRAACPARTMAMAAPTKQKPRPVAPAAPMGMAPASLAAKALESAANTTATSSSTAAALNPTRGTRNAGAALLCSPASKTAGTPSSSAIAAVDEDTLIAEW